MRRKVCGVQCDLALAASGEQLVGTLDGGFHDGAPDVVDGVALAVAVGEDGVLRTEVELGLVFEEEAVDRGQLRDDALRGFGLDALHADQPSVVLAHARDVDASAREVEVLAVEQTELADPQPRGHQRREQHETRDVIAIALRLGGPHLASADLGDEAVGDVVSARQGDVRRGARADSVNVVPCQPAMFALEQCASVEQSRDLKGLEEAARGTGLTNERLRVQRNIALDDAVAHRIL